MNTKLLKPRCRRCHRRLTAKESLALGVGPECAGKLVSGIGGIGSSVAEIAEIEKADQRIANIILNALAKGRRRDLESAKYWLARTRENIPAACAA